MSYPIYTQEEEEMHAYLDNLWWGIKTILGWIGVLFIVVAIHAHIGPKVWQLQCGDVGCAVDYAYDVLPANGGTLTIPTGTYDQTTPFDFSGDTVSFIGMHCEEPTGTHICENPPPDIQIPPSATSVSDDPQQIFMGEPNAPLSSACREFLGWVEHTTFTDPELSAIESQFKQACSK